MRIAPGTGFWLLLLAFALLSADAFARLRPNPWQRVGALMLIGLAGGLLLAVGTLQDVSILREYATRADVFWREGRTHIELALGSLVAATIVGVPLGVVCQRTAWLRAPVLNTLNAVQTIPSIALFGLLIAPLAWVAANLPGASAVGISGIGAAPALLALFAYSLLPVVANTLVGIDGVPPAADEAAKGMGMTDWQRLVLVQFPLAFPVILTGIRIVLVQNIGLTTIAALIGGGGFGVFVFQGVGQTAMDLVLLGAVPTIALSFAAADYSRCRRRAGNPRRRSKVIEIEDVTKTYEGATVVDHISLSVAEGAITAIVGTSGSGKTTLLRIINRLIEPSSGRVVINGRDTTSIPAYELRRQIGYVIQGNRSFPAPHGGAERRDGSEALGVGQGQNCGSGRRTPDPVPTRPRPLSRPPTRASVRRSAAASRRGAGRLLQSLSCC